MIEFAAALWNKAPAMLVAMKGKKISVPRLAPQEMADIVAYLRAYQYFAEPGNPESGRRLLAEKRCGACHSLDGVGGKSAADLARVKSLVSPAAVIAALWNHIELMKQSGRERDFSWPQVNSAEMSHLMAFFERSASGGN
jgi:cytochrome c